jgi:hypothetical protein
MEKMLFTTSGTGHRGRITVETFKIGGDFLGSSQIMMLLAKYRLDFEETVEEIIEMIIRGVASSVTITKTTPVIIDKIVGQGFRGRTSHPKTS